MIHLDFDCNPIREYNNTILSVIFKADNFVFVIFDPDNRILCHHSHNELGSYQAVLDQYQPALIKNAVKTNLFGHFASEDSIKSQYSNLNVDKMTGQDIWCAYDVSMLPKSIPTRHFSTLVNHHFFIRNKRLMHIHFDENEMHVYVVKKGEMILYYVFPFDGSGDLLYYHTLVVEGLGINTAETPLILSGLIEEGSKAYQTISSYHADIRFANTPRYTVNSSISELKPHHFLDHIVNIECV